MAASGVPESEIGWLLRTLRSAARYLLSIRRPFNWLLPLGWAGFIWLLSSLHPDGPGEPSKLDFFMNLAHAFEFGVLALLLLPLAPRDEDWVDTSPFVLTMIAAAAIGYGLLDETHQSWVPGRDPSLFDLMTDAVGVFCTLKVALYVIAPDSDGWGLRRELLAAFGLCLLAAALATLFGLAFGSGLWF